MGLKLALTIIDTKGALFADDISNESNYVKKRTEDLSPLDIHVGFYKDKIILLNESVNEIISEDSSLNHIERAFTNRYPTCEIVHIVQFDTINLAGYVVIENGIKKRAKCVANDQIYLDDDNFNSYEVSVLKEVKDAFLDLYPKTRGKILEAIKGKSDKDQLIYFLHFKNKVLKDNITYYNGNFEIELIHKIIPYFIDSDWSKLTDLEYVMFPHIRLTDENVSILEVVDQAYSILG